MPINTKTVGVQSAWADLKICILLLTDWREPKGNDLSRGVSTGKAEDHTEAHAGVGDNSFEEDYAPSVVGLGNRETGNVGAVWFMFEDLRQVAEQIGLPTQ